MNYRIIQRQRGVALLTAVMVTAFATTLVSGVIVAQNLSIHRATNLRAMDAAWWYLIGLEDWAGSILRRDAEDSQFDSLSEVWATPIDFLPVDEGVLSGQVTDLSGRFNLNLLSAGTREQSLPQFQRLLAAIPELAGENTAALGARIADWIDADAEPLPQGAEDEVYLSQEPPRRAANQPLVSISELRLIADMTPEMYLALAPHVTVAPIHIEWPGINVNTATGPVLQSISSDLTPADVQGLLAKREEAPWESLDQFNSEELMASRTVDAAIGVTSTLFRAEAAAQIDGVRLEMSSVLHRGPDKRVRVIAHSRTPL